MTNTLDMHAAAVAATFGKDTAAVAARVRALYAAHSDGLTGGKSLAELAAAATDARIAAAMPNLSRAEYPDYRVDDRYRVGKSTLGTYSLAASLIRDMGLAPSDLDDADLHAVYRTTANRAGIKEFRDDAVAAVLAADAVKRPALVFPLFDAAYSLYREAARQPEQPKGKPDVVVDTTPAADPADVERKADPTVLAMVPPSAEVLVSALEKVADDMASLDDADTLKVWATLEALYESVRATAAVRHAIVTAGYED